MVVIKLVSESDQVAVVSLIVAVNECMNEEFKAIQSGDVQGYLDWSTRRSEKDAELNEIVRRNITSRTTSKKEA